VAWRPSSTYFNLRTLYSYTPQPLYPPCPLLCYIVSSLMCEEALLWVKTDICVLLPRHVGVKGVTALIIHLPCFCTKAAARCQSCSGPINSKESKAVPLPPCRRQGERKCSFYILLNSALDGGEWSTSRAGRAFTPGEKTPGTHCTGGWVGPRAGLDTEDRGKIFCLCRGSNPGFPVCSQALY
jgi:hypothetical protein